MSDYKPARTDSNVA